MASNIQYNAFGDFLYPASFFFFFLLNAYFQTYVCNLVIAGLEMLRAMLLWF